MPDPRKLGNPLIDTTGDLIAFGIMGALGALALVGKAMEWAERRRGKALVLNTHGGARNTAWSGTSETR